MIGLYACQAVCLKLPQASVPCTPGRPRYAPDACIGTCHPMLPTLSAAATAQPAQLMARSTRNQPKMPISLNDLTPCGRNIDAWDAAVEKELDSALSCSGSMPAAAAGRPKRKPGLQLASRGKARHHQLWLAANTQPRQCTYEHNSQTWVQGHFAWKQELRQGFCTGGVQSSPELWPYAFPCCTCGSRKRLLGKITMAPAQVLGDVICPIGHS